MINVHDRAELIRSVIQTFWLIEGMQNGQTVWADDVMAMCRAILLILEAK